MAAVALIVFDQGGVGPAGEAFEGTLAGGLVTITNDDNTDVTSWSIELLDVPPNSGLVPGVLASAFTPTPTASFTPDVVGSYRILLVVSDGVLTNVDIRNFGIRNARGVILPPFQRNPDLLPLPGTGFPGEKPDEQNYGGQGRGWAGDRASGQLEEFFETYDDLAQLIITSTPFTAVVGDEEPLYIVELDTIGGPGVFNLPSGARDGQRFRILTQVSTYQLTVAAPGGHNIEGTSSVLVRGGTSRTFLFLSGVNWKMPRMGLSALTKDDKDLTPSNTPNLNEQPTGITISSLPVGDKWIQVEVNGITMTLGDGTKTETCYFSSDGGTTARTFASIASGDQLIWNSLVAGFQLDTGDSINLNYDN